MKRNELVGILCCVVLIFFTTTVWSAPVPDTGQTKCYNNDTEIPCPPEGGAFYGQDGSYTINTPSYTKLDENGAALADDAAEWIMVRDNVTGLVWEIKTSKDGVKDYNNPHDADNTYTWYDSNAATNGGYTGKPGEGTDTEDFIKSLNDANYGGHSDWRLPTIKELAFLVNYSILSPRSTIDMGYFPNTATSWYWSSTSYAYYTYYAWRVGFDSGEDYYADKTSYGCHVRAVRGGQSGAFDAVDDESANNALSDAGGFTDNGDGTVTDSSTGLMWQQAGSKTGDWEDCLAYCEGLSLGDHTDWRMPTVKELRSLVNYYRDNPAIDVTWFPDTAASLYWSSTTRVSSTSSAWSVNFGSGDDYYGSNNFFFDIKGSSRYVRAVRGGQNRLLNHLFISAPAQAAFLPIGSNMNIQWETQQIEGNFTITLSRDGGKTWETIIESTPNDTGSYTWTVTGPESVNCMLKIEPINDPSKGTLQGLFTIFQPDTESSVLSVTPTTRNVGSTSGTTTFDVSNTGGGTLEWTAEVLPDADWLRITSESSGTNAGTITCEYDPNTSTSSRTATIRVTSAGTGKIPMDVTVTQEGGSGGGGGGGGGGTVTPALAVTPTTREVAKETGSTTFSVSNTGSGTLYWSASVTSGSDWLKIKSGSSGTDTGTITCEYSANTAIASRTAIMRVTADGATGSPIEVTVKQAGTPGQPILSVTPASQDVGEASDTVTFTVSNTGTGIMNWTASVVSGTSWLKITDGASGTDTGTIVCAYDTNTASSSRSGKIRVTASDATESQKDVTITQAQKSQPVGENPGTTQETVQPEDMVNLTINTTNTHGDTPVYEWFVFTAIMDGTPLPLYLIADTGIFCLDDVINNLYDYTFSFDDDQLTSIAILSMSDLGLGSGDSFLYGYAYQNQANVIILENVVIIVVE